MLDTRQKTFGSTFRSLRDDLKDMNTNTRERYLIFAAQDDTQYPGDIRNVEERIIEAIPNLSTHGMFKHMTDGGRYINGFSRHWKTLEKLKFKWEIWRTTWKDHVIQRGDLIMDREWKDDQKKLSELYDTFTNSKPKGFEKDVEWTEKYSVESCLIAGIQTLGTDTDSKEMDFKSIGVKYKDTKDPAACDMPPPPCTAEASSPWKHTFGFNYRQLLQEVEDIVKLTDCKGAGGALSASEKTLEDIRKKGLEILSKVDSLQKDSLFTHMVYSWPQSHDSFIREWQQLVNVCSHWKGGVIFEQPDRTKLEHFISKVQNAEPKGLQRHPAWTEDSCAACCLATTKPPHIPYSQETWAHVKGIAPERLLTYTDEESANITFGGAWRRLVQDMKDMKQVNDSSDMKRFGSYDLGYWHRIEDLELRIIQNVNTLPKNAFFEDMIVSGLFQEHNDKFMALWKELEKLSMRWEDSKSMWKRNIEDFPNARSWAKDHDTLNHIYIEISDAWPKGAEKLPEWTKTNRPIAQPIKKDRPRNPERRLSM